MKTKEKSTTMTIEKSTTQSRLLEKNNQRQKMVDKLTEKIDRLTKSLETKKYIVEGGSVTGAALLDFLKTEALWKFTEAKGIVEAVKQVQTAVDNYTANKVKHLLIDSTALEAIYYFLSKVEKKGLDAAAFYIDNMVLPVSNALGRAKEDRMELDQLQRDRGTLEAAIDSGAEIENEDSILGEIEKELAKEI
jgi:murein L,D-transpeptidase YcbB/YkuD